ncbi:hypothetical protein HOD20_01460 [archaeon]|jgi:hypothetical protein|nr:hypothetical protein [archaeon]MBT4351172.1 hypothetical protein [archaeon]MBT4646939.1 hypothetical protein [archaeon]MBT6820793.1 hypothetical protein [archaeon]MBT7392122.1 hypothetical protein [archaeon]
MSKKLKKIHKKEKEITNLTFTGIILTIILIILLSYGLTNKIWKKDFQLGTASLRSSVQLYVTECLKKTLISGREVYGADIYNVKEYVYSNIEECTDNFNYLREEGFNIKQGIVSLIISYDNLGIHSKLKYPITVSKNGKEINIENFEFILQPTLEIITNDGFVNKGQIFISDNDLTSFEFNQETLIKDENDEKVKSLKITILHDNFINLGDKVVLGPLLYNDVNKITFSNPVKLTIKVPVKVLNRYDPTDVVIGMYNKDTALWNVYDNTILDEDLNYYIFSTTINKI